ncbi:hypothetical protein LAZ67_2003345 [Cordylochernes scorpioides]|uniref:RNase H type-1 domain-containing protein n=1 Tax=Cordylochernes scorpioides TaxID=51811 RepID=A0ABY6K3W4_9ARAC|nr:hypothetical protein LAZ67_2003345 [Cordylochernes scorpioides]
MEKENKSAWRRRLQVTSTGSDVSSSVAEASRPPSRSSINKLLHHSEVGKSPTDALYNLKSQISKSITSHQCCLLINLDIKSAFDHLWHPALLSSLSDIHLSPSLISIYTSFLNTRLGSKSGPFLWNIFFDPILSLPFPPGVHAQASADDLQLIIYGDPNYLTHNAKNSIDLIIELCLGNKLTIPKQIFNTPHLLQQTYHTHSKLQNSMRRRHHHPRNKILNLFPRQRSCANSYYGFGFKARKLFYLSVIEPTLIYAASIWAEAADIIAGKSRLRSAQRKFCINAIHGIRTVPTFTSFALLRVLPINLKLKLLSSLFKPSPLRQNTSHILIAIRNPTFSSTSLTSLSQNPHRTYHITPTAPKPLPGLPSLPSSPCLESSFPLSKHCTVFQAESFALLVALEDIRTLDTNLSIGIFSDCFSLLCTLSKHRCFHSIVPKCQILLHDLLSALNITLHWVKGHSGIYGDCRADALAKIGAADRSTTPKYKLASKSTTLTFLSSRQWKAWDDNFTRSNPTILRNLCIIPFSLKNTHKHIIPDSAITTGFITGHTSGLVPLGTLNPNTTGPHVDTVAAPPRPQNTFFWKAFP